MHVMSPVTERIGSLDVLRGFALLGILFMNIQAFSMPGSAYINPSSYGDFSGINFVVWMVSHVIFDQKFLSLFSMLFGVGVLLFCDRIENKGLKAASLHYRRMLWLLLFGLIHGYLFWYGDILYAYAMSGLLVFLFRHCKVTSLLVWATILLSIPSLFNLLTAYSFPYMQAEDVKNLKDIWRPSEAMVQEEIANYTGGWMSALNERFEDTFFMQTFLFLTAIVWRTLGMMLIGMALYKSRFFTLDWSDKRYGLVALLGLMIGLTMIVYGVMQNVESGFSLEYSMFSGSQYNYWGSILVALGYASLVMLAVKHKVLINLQQRLAAVGRIAFTNYIMQTIICTTVFYSLGYFGEFSRVEQLFTVLAICALQLWVSPIWLREYRYGPLEWGWRCLTYWHREPLRRQSTATAHA